MRLFHLVVIVLSAFTSAGIADEPKSSVLDEAGKHAKHDHDHECALDFKMKSIQGKAVDLEEYEGKVVLIVNTASKCGMTGHYKGLQALYEKYGEKGFVVLGFPCNQFGTQEPGTNAEIATFCSTTYDVTFPMFSKIEVKGDNAAPIFKHLTSVDAKPAGKGPVGWNFEKFLLDREGQVAARFPSYAKPNSPALVKAIEAELQKKTEK